MTQPTHSPTTPTQPVPRTGKTGRGERTAWWITFGILTVTLVTMLSLWN